MSVARRLARLFKWVIECQKMANLIKSPPADGNEVDLALALLTRLGFFGFWFFDNLWVLAHIGFLKRDATPFKKPGMASWFFGLVCNVIATVRSL